MVSKGFAVYICDADGVETQYIGNFASIYLERSGTVTGTVTVNEADFDNTYFRRYTAEPEYIGGMCSTYLFDTDRQDAAAMLLKGCPLLVYKDIAAYVGQHVKIINSNNYYAISEAIRSQNNITKWTLYDNNNNVVFTDAPTGTIPFPFSNSNGIRQQLGIINNDIVDADGRASMTITAPYASLITNIDVTNITSNAAQRTILGWWNALNKEAPPAPPTDPYAQGGTSGTGGGTGTFDLSSDPVDFPALPTLTAVSTGLVSVYTPTLSQLNALASYMWNANPTDIDWWKKLVANPLDLILGLSIVPVAVPAGASNSVKVGLIDTGVTMTRAASQFVEVDCGSLEIKEFWGSALDYSPFRKHSIYLPFIGTRTISTDDIMGKTVHVKYHVDLLSGALTALVKCGDAVLYQYSGACGVSLPLTGETFTNMITSTIQLATGIAGTVASGGAAAGVAIASAANSVMSMKPVVERAGGVSGAAGQLGVMTPYIIGEIPRQSVPENYNTFAGYPSNIKATLGDLSGFTSIETIQLQNIPATAAEYTEIEQLLKEGVIL